MVYAGTGAAGRGAIETTDSAAGTEFVGAMTGRAHAPDARTPMIARGNRRRSTETSMGDRRVQQTLQHSGRFCLCQFTRRTRTLTCQLSHAALASRGAPASFSDRQAASHGGPFIGPMWEQP